MFSSLRAFMQNNPGGGSAQPLTANFVNAIGSNAGSTGIFAPQLVAFKLNLDFALAGFLGDCRNFDEFTIGCGKLEGLTVQQIFDIANQAFGGGANNLSGLQAVCPTCTLSNLVCVVDKINRSFDNGISVHYLIAPNGELTGTCVGC